MAETPISISLYGAKGKRFESIKGEMATLLGYEPSNPEVVGLLMGEVDDVADLEPITSHNG